MVASRLSAPPKRALRAVAATARRVGTWPWIIVALVALLAVVVTAPVVRGALLPEETESPAPAQEFASRPDLAPPVVNIHTPAAEDTAPGYLFLAPKSTVRQSTPVIMTDGGRLVWSGVDYRERTTDFRVQRYRGEPVLTFWEGEFQNGYGEGHFVILDSSYREVATVTAANGYAGDIHEFTLTPRGTALIVMYREERADLSGEGGPADGWVYDGVFQEIDVATGELVRQWRALDHVAFSESYATLDQEGDPDTASGDGTAEHPYDYFHINAVDTNAEGDYLVTARNTHAVYKIDGDTGEILWRLGGRESDFAMGEGSGFAWQHDARFLGGDRISLFNNAASPATEERSRAMVLDLDTERMRARLENAYGMPDGRLSGTQGNAQVLDNGNVLVGWGAQPYITEFASGGAELLHLDFGAGADSYRAYRAKWRGSPTEPPDVATDLTGDGAMEVAVSWNGATEVRRWRLLGGVDADALTAITTADHAGFETVIRAAARPYVAVEALDADGSVLGVSPTVPVGSPPLNPPTPLTRGEAVGAELP